MCVCVCLWRRRRRRGGGERQSAKESGNPKGWGPKRVGTRRVGAQKGGVPKFRAFSLLPPPIFFLSSSLWGSLSWKCARGSSHDPPKLLHVWASLGSFHRPPGFHTIGLAKVGHERPFLFSASIVSELFDPIVLIFLAKCVRMTFYQHCFLQVRTPADAVTSVLAQVAKLGSGANGQRRSTSSMPMTPLPTYERLERSKPSSCNVHEPGR